MWTISELKRKGKAAFQANYWKTVVIALILAIVAGGAFGSVGFGVNGSDIKEIFQENDSSITEYDDDWNDGRDQDNRDLRGSEKSWNGEESWEGDSSSQDEGDVSGFPSGMFTVGVTVGIIVISLIAVAIVIVISVFLLNPLEVGGRRYTILNLNRPAQVGEVTYVFDSNYKSVVRTMFFRALYTFLWSLLFVIPGIIKYYEYRMIPYLLAEDPDMTREEAFARSKQMMTGNKWHAFLLDLSFIGWELLSVITLGILRLFYVGPYKEMTSAALYERLRYGNPAGPQGGSWNNPSGNWNNPNGQSWQGGQNPNGNWNNPNGPGWQGGQNPNGNWNNPNGQSWQGGQNPNGSWNNPNGQSWQGGQNPNGSWNNPNGQSWQGGQNPNGNWNNPNGQSWQGGQYPGYSWNQQASQNTDGGWNSRASGSNPAEQDTGAFASGQERTENAGNDVAAGTEPEGNAGSDVAAGTDSAGDDAEETPDPTDLP